MNVLERVFSYSTNVQDRMSEVEVEIVDAVQRVAKRKSDTLVEWDGENVAPGKITRVVE